MNRLTTMIFVGSISLFCCGKSVAQKNSTSVNTRSIKENVLTTISSSDLVIEKRAALRVLLSHEQGCSIAGYRMKDKTFLIRSTDEVSAERMRERVSRLYPETIVKGNIEGNSEQNGFKGTEERLIKAENGFPVFIITGDNELDALSYQYEKETWYQQHPNTSK